MNFHDIYEKQAALYDLLVTREDHAANLSGQLSTLLGDLHFEKFGIPSRFRQPASRVWSRTVSEPSAGIILELGAGTGRVTRILEGLGHRVAATDLHFSMLHELVRRNRGSNSGQMPLRAESRTAAIETATVWPIQADNMALPFRRGTFVAAVAGWTLCHLVDDLPDHWPGVLDSVIGTVLACIAPGGRFVIIETLGTGNETPEPPEHLLPYFERLEEVHGFSRMSIRTDYRFESKAEALELTGFFFGPDMASRLTKDDTIVKDETAAPVCDAAPVCLAECTGIWVAASGASLPGPKNIR